MIQPRENFKSIPIPLKSIRKSIINKKKKKNIKTNSQIITSLKKEYSIRKIAQKRNVVCVIKI